MLALRRPSSYVVALSLLLVLGGGAASAAEPADSTTAEMQEWELLDLINRDRAAGGLRALKMQTDLRDYARFHARAQRTKGTLWHDMEEYKTWAPAGWTRLGENVGYNGGVMALRAAYMASAGHRANVLNPDFTHVGIGVMASGTTLWNSQNFLTHASTTLPLAVRPGAPVVDKTPPAAAGTPVRIAGTTGYVAFRWTGATDNVRVIGYRVYAGTTLIGTTKGRGFADFMARPGTTRTYTVRAYDAAGNLGAASGSLRVALP